MQFSYRQIFFPIHEPLLHRARRVCSPQALCNPRPSRRLGSVCNRLSQILQQSVEAFC
jgi:hypothetical protein